VESFGEAQEHGTYGRGGGRDRRSRLQARMPTQRVDEWVDTLTPCAWQRIALRDSTQGRLEVEVVNQCVWLWDGKEKQPHHWHWLELDYFSTVTDSRQRDIDSPRS
jgi:hypothetical protein